MKKLISWLVLLVCSTMLEGCRQKEEIPKKEIAVERKVIPVFVTNIVLVTNFVEALRPSKEETELDSMKDYDIPKTIQYLRQKLEALNIPIYGGTVTYLMLPQAKGDVKDHNLKIHEVWDGGSGNSSNLLLDFSELDSSSVKYERIELDAYRIIMRTADDRRVIKCGANLLSSDYCNSARIFTTTEKNARSGVNAIKHLIQLEGGKESKKDPFDK